MSVAVHIAARLTVDEYLEWAMTQPEGRFELVGGEVVAMAPERARHNLMKAEAYVALRDAIRRDGIACTAYTDGISVKINDDTVREPDALVQCGKPIDPDALVATNPVIVVEVISPSSKSSDTTQKLSEYFTVPSIQHYLILDGEKRLIVHHARGEASDEIRSRIVRGGDIHLDPPGLTLSLADLFPNEG